MFDTSPDGLLRLIKQGESQTVEFKLRVPPSEIIARNFAAFANSEGGILLLGVGDDGSIIGLTDREANEAMLLLQHVADSLLSWPIGIGTTLVEAKKVVYAIIDKAPEHLAPIVTARGEVFTRVEQQTRPMPLSEYVRTTSSLPRSIQRPVVVFVAMSFREEEEPALVDYYRAMKRVVKEVDLPIELRRIDFVEGDYEISQQIMDEIDHAEIVITDFTLSARNVYFELGYARGKQKRIIQTARKGTTLEFDIRNWRTLFYRNATELEEKLIPELRAAYNEAVETAR
jgi:Schlafen, AlbA_2